RPEAADPASRSCHPLPAASDRGGDGARVHGAFLSVPTMEYPRGRLVPGWLLQLGVIAVCVGPVLLVFTAVGTATLLVFRRALRLRLRRRLQVLSAGKRMNVLTVLPRDGSSGSEGEDPDTAALMKWLAREFGLSTEMTPANVSCAAAAEPSPAETA